MFNTELVDVISARFINRVMTFLLIAWNLRIAFVQDKQKNKGVLKKIIENKCNIYIFILTTA